MAGSMKEIKLRIKSVESTMQITKAMELVASSKLRRAKERVEHSRPYFETLYATLFDIAAADSEFSSPYLPATAAWLAATTPTSLKRWRQMPPMPRSRVIAYCPSVKRQSNISSAIMPRS